MCVSMHQVIGKCLNFLKCRFQESTGGGCVKQHICRDLDRIAGHCGGSEIGRDVGSTLAHHRSFLAHINSSTFFSSLQQFSGDGRLSLFQFSTSTIRIDTVSIASAIADSGGNQMPGVVRSLSNDIPVLLQQRVCLV